MLPGSVWNPFGQPLTTVNHEQLLTTIVNDHYMTAIAASLRQTVTAVYPIPTDFPTLLSVTLNL